MHEATCLDNCTQYRSLNILCLRIVCTDCFGRDTVQLGIPCIGAVFHRLDRSNQSNRLNRSNLWSQSMCPRDNIQPRMLLLSCIGAAFHRLDRSNHLNRLNRSCQSLPRSSSIDNIRTHSSMLSKPCTAMRQSLSLMQSSTLSCMKTGTRMKKCSIGSGSSAHLTAVSRSRMGSESHCSQSSKSSRRFLCS